MVEFAISIDECLDPAHPTREEAWNGVTIHRIQVPAGHDAMAISRFDRMQRALGNMMAYGFVVHPSGFIEQSLPLNRHGWDAREYSKSCVAVACIGDFRRVAMSRLQYRGLVDLCTILSLKRPGVGIWGHTERPNATKYRNHDCPGAMVNMTKLRTDVQAVCAKLRHTPQTFPFIEDVADCNECVVGSYNLGEDNGQDGNQSEESPQAKGSED